MIVALAIVCAIPVGAQQGPPNWALVYDFAVQDVCLTAAGSPAINLPPTEASCLQRRNLLVGEKLTYHKHDWPTKQSAAARPQGYQRTDSFPVRTKLLGTVVVNARGFGGTRDATFGVFSPGHAGGGLYVFSKDTFAGAITQDSVGGVQIFYGPRCDSENPAERIQDAWVLVDKTFTLNQPGDTIARLSRKLSGCPNKLASSYTQWRTEELTFRIRWQGVTTPHKLLTLVSEHFAGKSLAEAGNMERFYLTRELGLIRWERWQNLSRQHRPRDIERAFDTEKSERCDEPSAHLPGQGNWVNVACRQYTNLVPADNKDGDAPTFWISYVRELPHIKIYLAE
jgi:hypothetical protein